MATINILQATESFEKTMVMGLYRLGICLAISFSYILATFMGAGAGFAVGSSGTDPAFYASIGAVIGFGICGFILYNIRRSLFFAPRTSHIALLEKALRGDTITGDKNQIDAGKALVTARFKNASTLFALDQSIKIILTDLLFNINPVAQKIPSIANRFLHTMVRWIVSLPLAFSDQVLVSFVLRQKSEPMAQAAKTALIFYAQHFKDLFKTASMLFAAVIIGICALFLLLRIPVGWVVEFIPFSVGTWSIMCSVLLAWSFITAFFEPIVLVVLMGYFFTLTKDQAPNPDWEHRLLEISNEFNYLSKDANQSGP